MKTMAEREYIKHLYENEGKSLREIAKLTNVNFRTARKYAHQTDWNTGGLPDIEPKKYPILGTYIPVINEWLVQDQREPRKQRHTAKQIHRRLQKEQNYSGSYSSVKKYVRKKRFIMKQAREGYLPLSQPAGHAQVDFGAFKYYNGLNEAKEGHALVVTFPYSNAGWMQVYPSENQECLLEGMKRIFKHIGGAPVRIKTDNMTTAVSQILKGHERVLTDGFTRFKLHYRFETEFCNPSSGHEKGSVENKVGYDRRTMLVPVPVIDDFDKYNEELLRLCEEDHDRPHYKHGVQISGLWEREKEHLLTLPEYEYEIFRYEALSVNKYGFITIDTNKYGISPEFMGKTIQAKIYYNRVEIYYDRNLLKTYERSYERNTEVMDWKQYLPLMTRKPGAAANVRFFNQLPKLWREHLRTTHGKDRKTALMLLHEIVRDGNESFCDDVLSLAIDCGRTDADSIKHCYYMFAKSERGPAPLALNVTAPSFDYRPNLTDYDMLLKTEPESLPTITPHTQSSVLPVYCDVR